MATPPPVQVDKMTAQQFYGLFSDLCIDNPPGPHDYPMIHRLERTGLILGQHFDLSSAAPQIQLAFDRATTDGNALVAQLGRQAAGEGSAGWVYSTTGGAGVDYNNRAAVAYYALGMNLPRDAVYPSASADSDGQPLDGRDSYVLHLDTASPVDAFWSVTAYDADGYFISNPIGRQALGDRDPLAVNTDGSIDIYIQAASPDTAKAPNWLPVAEAPFTLLIRLYFPRDEVLTKAWTPPPLRRQGQPH